MMTFDSQPSWQVAPAWVRHLVVLVVSSMLSACATAPSQEMADARLALRAAQGAGAGYSAPNRFRSAQRRVEHAAEQLRLRQFEVARLAAIEARDEAVAARRLALAFRHLEEETEKARIAGRDVAELEHELRLALLDSRAGRERDAHARLERLRERLE